MLSARPLYDTDGDAQLFVEPGGWDRLVRAVDHGFNVAVVAPRGGGKTSALRQLQRRLRAKGTGVAYVDATGVENVSNLVSRVEFEVAGRPNALHELRDEFSFAAGVVAGGPPGSTSVRLIQRLRNLDAKPPTIILVDCAHAADMAQALFGRLRDELWQLHHRWVVAIEDGERSILLTPPADAFFDQVIALEMSGGDLREMLRRRDPPELDDSTIERIAASADTPREALQAARDAATSTNREYPLGASLWRQERAAVLGRPHSMAMSELEALGGVSASDEEFLRRLGWSRARASQVLSELAEAGLVRPSDERTPGGRRPRRVFRPADPPPGALLVTQRSTESGRRHS